MHHRPHLIVLTGHARANRMQDRVEGVMANAKLAMALHPIQQPAAGEPETRHSPYAWPEAPGEGEEQMADPMLLAIATTIATKAGTALVESGQNAVAALVRIVRDRFREEPTADAALATAFASPDESSIDSLRKEIERISTLDDAFLARLKQAWSEVPTNLRVDHSTTLSKFSAQHVEKLVQAETINGDINF